MPSPSPEGNALAQRGYSRDGRGDCKQVVIGLVVSRCGLPLGYEVFAGNRSDVTTLARRVGLLLGQNTRAAGLFDVRVTADAKGAAQVKWSKREEWRSWASLSDGCYLLQTNVNDGSGQELWRAYMQLAEAVEGAFRIHKSDLEPRPIWHQKESRVKAHILVCCV